MSVIQKISVELPDDVARIVRDQIAAGRYASDSEAVVEALRSAHEEDQAIDAWLRNELGPAIDEIQAGTATLLTSDEVRERLGLMR